MIQIDSDPANRLPDHRCEPGRTPPPDCWPAEALSPAAAADMPVDRRPAERPSLFVVPPPQAVWPRVFPGL